MESRGHKPVLRGTSYVCANCGDFLLDVRTSAKLRMLKDIDPVKRDAVERRMLTDPKLAKRLVDEDPREVVSTYKLADKFNDFLMNPKARPDLQTPEAQQFLQSLQDHYLNEKTDEMMPWLTREWKKGRIQFTPPIEHQGMEVRSPNLRFDAGPEYAYDVRNPHDPDEVVQATYHRLSPDTLSHWADWYRSDHPSRQGQDIMQLKTPELHQTIKDWDQDMREKAVQQAQVRGDVEHTYPDGWTLQRLNSEKALKDEGDSMGHCVGGYWGPVQRGNTIIHSLRDPHNNPHATMETAPQWAECPDCDWLGSKPGSNAEPARCPNCNGADWRPSMKNGEVVQIQGKANQRPLPEYQQRFKDYFENKFPDEEERPGWGDQEYEDLDEIEEGQQYGYHDGDYGLREPDMRFNWESLIENAEYYGQNVNDLVKVAAEHNELGTLQHEAENAEEWKRSDYRNNMDWGIYEEEERQWKEDYEENFPPPDSGSEEYWPDPDEKEQEAGYTEPQFDEAAYEADLHEWERDLENDLREAEPQLIDQVWESSDTHHFFEELRVAVAKARRQQREPQQPNPARTSATRSAHPRYITGEPCYCTFTKHLEEAPPMANWYVSAQLVCEACGDPLEHGSCKRCDWGGWSNAMGTENPSDPTQDVKPGITNAI